ncbi:MAG: cyclase family protein [Chloroflexi bacterium]|nr:cyclase family protein [Chloroflexota bacterium]
MMYDLTHRLTDDVPTYPADPHVRIITGFGVRPWCVSALHLGSHSGTHVDAPLHYMVAGRGIGAYAPDRFVGRGIVIDARGYEPDAPVGPEILTDYHLRPGMIAVIRTGWEIFWNDARYFQHPYLSDGLAQALVERGISLVAVDALNVDSTPGSGETVHATLLGADILIAENLCGLEQLDCGREYVFAILPLALGDVDGAPVRALAWDIDHRFGS